MTELLSDTDTPSDAELISRVRGGDVAAYGELFSRHVQAANRLARQLVRGPDADDLVSDAFAKVLGVLQAGGGPDVAFRAYLLTAVRRLQVDRVRAGSRLQTSDDMSQFDPGIPFQDTAVSGFESGAAARAFASLPERWQLVLWHLEVEGQKPADIAPLLGMSPNSVSALAYRAREGLRQAFLTMHLSDISADSCRWVNEHLGAYVRHGLAKRDGAKVEDHLRECRRCTAMYLELTEVNSDLKAIIAPLLLGAAATGYLASTGSAGTAGAFALLGRVRDVIMANAGVAGAGAAAAGVAAVATTAVLLTQGHPDVVVGADRPVAATTHVAPSSGSAAPTSRPSSGGGPSAGAGGPAGSGSTASAGALAPGTATSSSTSTPAGTAAGSTPGAGTAPGTGPGAGPGAGPASTAPAGPRTSPAGQKSGDATPTPGGSHSSPGGSTGPGGSPGTPTPSPTHRPTTTPTSGQTSTPSPGNGGSTGSPGDPSTSPTTPSDTGSTGDTGNTGGPSTPPDPGSTGGTGDTGGSGDGGSGNTGGGSGDAGGGTSVTPVLLTAGIVQPPDASGAFPVPMTISGLPSDVQQMTFTVATSNTATLMGLREFTASSPASFAALPEDPTGQPIESCTLSEDATTATCTGIANGASATLPIKLANLTKTAVSITATASTTTGEDVPGTPSTVTIDPPEADIALSAVDVSQDKGNYRISGSVTGIPTDYGYPVPAVSVASGDDTVELTTISNTMCDTADSTGKCAFNVVVSVDPAPDGTPATVTVGSLPGYIDGNDALANNSRPLTLKPPVTGPLQLEITNVEDGDNAAQRKVFVSVTGAKPGSDLVFKLPMVNGQSVIFDELPTGCDWTDGTGKDESSVTCFGAANKEGSFSNAGQGFAVKLPSGQLDGATLVVSDGEQPDSSQPLEPQTP